VFKRGRGKSPNIAVESCILFAKALIESAIWLGEGE